jgi:hypothetical protein
MDPNEEIKQKVEELAAIMSSYHGQLGQFEHELSQALHDYQKALDEEKLKEVRDSIASQS